MKETRDYCKRELQRLHDEEETDWEEEEEEEDGEYISVETSQKTREKAGTGLKVMNTGTNNNKKVPCPSADIKHAAPSKKPHEKKSATPLWLHLKTNILIYEYHYPTRHIF